MKKIQNYWETSQTQKGEKKKAKKPTTKKEKP